MKKNEMLRNAVATGLFAFAAWMSNKDDATVSTTHGDKNCFLVESTGLCTAKALDALAVSAKKPVPATMTHGF